MTKVVETTRVLKKTSAKVMAWDNGVLRQVYFNEPNLHGSPAKYFIRSRDNQGRKRVVVVAGKVYQDNDGKVYFLNS
jgi:hypothetical protein